MPMYRKKPVVIEAFQFDSETTGNAIVKWSAGMVRGVFDDDEGPYLSIETHEGIMRATLGDWVIKGIAHEYYPCKDDIFQATYDQAGE
jgi:hypothetical protein